MHLFFILKIKCIKYINVCIKFITQYCIHYAILEYIGCKGSLLFCEGRQKMCLCVRARKLIDFWYTELYASTSVPAYKYPQRPLLSIAPTTPEISIVIGKWTRRVRAKARIVVQSGLFTFEMVTLNSDFRQTIILRLTINQVERIFRKSVWEKYFINKKPRF